MRWTFVFPAVLLTALACGGALDPNAPILISFNYAENQQPSTSDVPYDSVTATARTVLIGRAAFGSLCGGRLTAGVSSSGAEVTLKVTQSPIAGCAVPAGLVAYFGNIQLIPGSYHLRVIETNAAHPQGAVVIDRPVIVPASD